MKIMEDCCSFEKQAWQKNQEQTIIFTYDLYAPKIAK